MLCIWIIVSLAGVLVLEWVQCDWLSNVAFILCSSIGEWAGQGMLSVTGLVRFLVQWPGSNCSGIFMSQQLLQERNYFRWPNAAWSISFEATVVGSIATSCHLKKNASTLWRAWGRWGSVSPAFYYHTSLEHGREGAGGAIFFYSVLPLV